MEQPLGNVQRFYDEVFEDFKNRLFIGYRFKSSISSQQIDKFTKIVREKMHKKRAIFQAGIHNSLEKKPISIGNNKVKIEHLQEEYSPIKQHVIRENQKQSENSQSQQSEDDLNAFKERNKQPEVKVQQPPEKQQYLNDNSEELYEEEDRQKEEILMKSTEKISAHILATYNTRNKKHIPKDQRTKIDLQNVFVRTADKQVYYAKISCEFKQAVYSKINL